MPLILPTYYPFLSMIPLSFLESLAQKNNFKSLDITEIIKKLTKLIYVEFSVMVMWVRYVHIGLTNRIGH